MIVALLILSGFAAAFVLILVDVDRLIAEAEFLDSIWEDDSYDDGGRASSADRAKATTPAAVLYLVEERRK